MAQCPMDSGAGALPTKLMGTMRGGGPFHMGGGGGGVGVGVGSSRHSGSSPRDTAPSAMVSSASASRRMRSVS